MSTSMCTHTISRGQLFFDRRETCTHLGGTSNKRAYSARNIYNSSDLPHCREKERDGGGAARLAGHWSADAKLSA